MLFDFANFLENSIFDVNEHVLKCTTSCIGAQNVNVLSDSYEVNSHPIQTPLQ